MGKVLRYLQYKGKRYPVTELAPRITMCGLIHSGAPVVAGRRISTEWIAGRFRGGESVAALARDFDLEPGDIEAALRFEFELRVKRLKRPRA